MKIVVFGRLTGFFVQGEMPVCIVVSDNCHLCDVLVEVGMWMATVFCMSFFR